MARIRGAREVQSGDMVRLKNGVQISIFQPPEVDQVSWREVKKWLESHGELTESVQSMLRQPDTMRTYLEVQACSQFYSENLGSWDARIELMNQLAALEEEPVIEHVLDEIRERGLEALIKYWDDEDLMVKMAEKWRFLPPGFLHCLAEMEEEPITFHEAAALAKLPELADHVRNTDHIDLQDMKGITPLGYAIGQGHTNVVARLVAAGANVHSVDANGNNALHYAAGYGRKDMLDMLGNSLVDINQVNKNGQTPLTVATMNRHQDCIEILLGRGALAV